MFREFHYSRQSDKRGLAPAPDARRSNAAFGGIGIVRPRVYLEPPRSFMQDLRDATPEDASAIAAIYNESITARDSTMQLERVDAETVERWIRALGEREAVLLLEGEAEIVGYGVVKRYSDRGGYRFAAETSVYLRRARTGEGLGSTLQAALIDRCRAHGYHHLVAKLWAENERSRALHRKFGYDLVGVQREIGYVEGTWRDIAIMQKRLNDPTTNE